MNPFHQVLGRRCADSGHLLSVDSLVEGIVCFEDEAAAETFGFALEVEGRQVSCWNQTLPDACCMS